LFGKKDKNKNQNQSGVSAPPSTPQENAVKLLNARLRTYDYNGGLTPEEAERIAQAQKRMEG